MKYEIVNQIPENLPPGEYNTRIVEVDWSRLTIKLEFLGTPYNPTNPQCLISATKHEVDETKLG